MGPTAGVDAVVKRKIPHLCPRRELNPGKGGSTKEINNPKTARPVATSPEWKSVNFVAATVIGRRVGTDPDTGRY
jgi:hypothetical protein